MRIIFVRHGNTKTNQLNALAGAGLDVPLSRQGLREAKAVGKRLSREKVCEIYTSPMRRARETAREIARFHPGAKVLIEPALEETFFGKYEGAIFSKVPKGVLTALFTHPVNPSFRKHGGESWSDVARRLSKLIRRISRRGRKLGPEGAIVVVSHLATGRVFLSEILGLPLTHHRIFCLDNASVSEISLNKYNGQPELRLLNDRKHLRKR